MSPYIYFELEDRYYRSPVNDQLTMERWSPLSRQWVLYEGDAARIIVEATRHRDAPRETR